MWPTLPPPYHTALSEILILSVSVMDELYKTGYLRNSAHWREQWARNGYQSRTIVCSTVPETHPTQTSSVRKQRIDRSILISFHPNKPPRNFAWTAIDIKRREQVATSQSSPVGQTHPLFTDTLTGLPLNIVITGFFGYLCILWLPVIQNWWLAKNGKIVPTSCSAHNSLQILANSQPNNHATVSLYRLQI